jgi:hypothetical protein
VKKKESLWELIKRLDEQAGQFNLYLAEANRYFDNTVDVTKTLLDRHERDFNKLIEKVKSVLKFY